MRDANIPSPKKPTNELGEAIETFRSLAGSLQLFLLMYRHLKEKPQSSYPEIARQISLYDHVDVPHARLSEAVNQIEDRLDVKLVISSPKSKSNVLTGEADLLKRKAEVLVKRTMYLAEPNRTIRIGAPDLLNNFVIPTIAAECRREWVNNSEYDKVSFEVSECRESEEIVNKVAHGDIDFALTWAYEDKLNRLKRLSKPRELRVEKLFEVEGVEFESPTKLEFDVLMICSPTHRFVKLAQEAGKHVHPWRVSLEELSNEIVVVLPHRRQPLLEKIPMPPASKGRFVEVDSFTQVLAHVRGLIPNAVGLVPSIYTEINELRRKGQIFCAPILIPPEEYEPVTVPEEGKPLEEDEPVTAKVSIACVSQGGIARLGEQARAFLRRCEPVLRRIAKLDEFESSVLAEVPGEIEEFRHYQHCYFVMQHKQVFGIPGWFEGEVSWEPSEADQAIAGQHREGRLRGHLGGTFITTTSKKWSFKINAWLRQNEERRAQNDRSFQFVGEGQSPSQKNTIICTFNIRIRHGEHDVLIGVWSGRDDNGLATVAPMVLARESFGRDLDSLRTLISRSSYRFLPNAEDWGVGHG